MIDSKAMMVGNWVYYKGTEYQVTTIATDYIDVQRGLIPTILEATKREDFEPIPITPELLNKCGFETKLENKCFDLVIDTYNETVTRYIRIDLINDSGYCLINNEITLNKNVKYLHQLQNLIYSLTKTQLNIQL